MRAFWKFLSSLKLAIVLLILLAVASAVGTLVPQGRSLEEYNRRYGASYSTIKALKFDRVYKSGWFIGLLLLFSVNTIACTVSRFPGKWRRAAGPTPSFEAASLKALKVRDSFRQPVSFDASAEAAAGVLRDRRYSVKRSMKDGSVFIVARKRRLGWFGSDLVHAGLLVVIAGGIVSGIGAKRLPLNFAEGTLVAVPGANFSIRMDKFRTEHYPGGGVKDWKSDLTIIEAGRPVRTATIEVNHPLRYKGVNLYQSGYGWSWDNADLELMIKKASDPSFVRLASVKTGRTVELAGPGITAVSVRNFVPDFVVGKGNQIMSRSDEPKNPAALVEVWNGREKVFMGWVFSKFPDFKGMGEKGKAKPDFSVVMKTPAPAQFSVIDARRDPGAPFIWAGCVFLSLGLILAFYWRPREIRLVIRDSAGATELSAGGTARGGTEAFQAEFEGIMKAIRSRA